MNVWAIAKNYTAPNGSQITAYWCGSSDGLIGDMWRPLKEDYRRRCSARPSRRAGWGSSRGRREAVDVGRGGCALAAFHGVVQLAQFTAGREQVLAAAVVGGGDFVLGQADRGVLQ
jgi:hypothetical protein